MLSSATGSLSIVDLNSNTPRFFWRGLELQHVLSCASMVRPGQRRVALRVTDPDNVTPALSVEDKAVLNGIYDEMAATAGLVVIKA